MRNAVDRPIEREYRSAIADNLRWKLLTIRPGDIFVCTPPKCGTTWMQTIVSTLLFPDGAPGVVMQVSPWIDARFNAIDDIRERLEAQTFRRSMKTHTPANGIPWSSSAFYIVVGRDGRDAFMSRLNHMRNMRPEVVERLAASAIEDGIDVQSPPPLEDEHEYFAWWLTNDYWFDHVASFWSHRDESNVLFVHYDDMKVDLGVQMRRVAAFIGVEIEESQWPELVERCTFAAMKERAADIGDFDRLFAGGADAFLYKATNGRWRDLLTPAELAAFDQRAAETLPPDALAWTKGGHSAVGGP